MNESLEQESNINPTRRGLSRLVGVAALIGIAAWGVNNAPDYADKLIDEAYVNIGESLNEQILDSNPGR